MSRLVSPGLLLAITLVAACQPKSASLSDTDKTALRTDTDKWVQNVLAKNWAAVAAMYAPDASFMPPNEPAVNGRAAIQAWMAAFPPVSAFKPEIQDVDGGGEIAYVRGAYAMSFTPPGAASPVEDHGKYIEIHRRQPDGTWLITADIFNSDVSASPPAPAPGPAPARK